MQQLREQVAPIGRFAQPRVTGDAKGPPCEAMFTWYDADSPAFTVADAGETPTPKFVTVIRMLVAAVNATPLLLADTLTFDVPNGHEIVEPGDVPQPPVHDSRVRPHWFGSAKPS